MYTITIVNNVTGEIATKEFAADEQEAICDFVSLWCDLDEPEDEDYEPDYDECGFNPYMGCYDFDC